MKTFIRRIMDILDGVPVVQGKNNKGQSVMELALVTPILIILIVGIVEIGWFANNYLILLEVTRVGARRGAVLTGDNVPQRPVVWNGNDLTIADSVAERGAAGGAGLDPSDPNNNNSFSRWQDARDCGLIGNAYVGFYNLVLCQMINSLDPLQLNYDPFVTLAEEDQTDDIIISVFAIQMVQNGPGGNYDFTSAAYRNNRPTRPEDNVPDLAYEYEMQGWLPVVVGRFPVNANECTAFEVLGGTTSVTWDDTTTGTVLERDPFDYVHDDALTTFPLDWTGVTGVTFNGTGDAFTPDGRALPRDYPIELHIPDPNQPGSWLPVGLDRGLEAQRGFTYSGYHRVESEPIQVTDATGTYQAQLECYGSNWTIYDVQELIRGDDFVMSPDEIADMQAVDSGFGVDQFGNPIDTRQFFANLGLVLVEVYWRHELLLDMPVFSPVFNALGGDQTTIYVWSAFPTPSASPNLRYDLDTDDFYAPPS